MEKKEIRCMVDAEVVDKLNLVLQLNKENLDFVVENLLTSYISESFMKAAKDMSFGSKRPTAQIMQTVPVANDDPNYGKANRKIPIWAQRPNQNNHRIIKAYLMIEDEKGYVTVEELALRCSNEKLYSTTFVTDFRGNFTQMKTDASNSHGKVFIVENDRVEIWNEVLETLMKYKEEFLQSYSGERVKITDDMVQGAYKIAKMVYAGDIGRNDAKYKIIQETGMSAGSAGDYIQNFLAMMEGKKYTRTLSAYATRYYLEHIRADFGELHFQTALKATRAHIQYYNGLQNGNLNIIQEILEDLSK